MGRGEGRGEEGGEEGEEFHHVTLARLVTGLCRDHFI